MEAGFTFHTMILLTRPFSICKILLVFGLQTIGIAAETLVELLKGSIMLHLNMFGKSIIWLLALITLPLRVLTALQRERMLEENLHELQNEVASLLWEKKELGDKFQASIRERKILEMMLAEVEEENDKAITQIKLLKSQMMKFQLDKGYWDSKACQGSSNDVDVADNYGLSSRMQTTKSKESGTMGKGVSKGENDTKLHSFLATPAGVSLHQHEISPRNMNTNVRDEKKELAVQQSLCSAIMSLSVGMIIWQAEDSCMPLVVALFTVVAMSLKSVFTFFSTIENKPATDAVALLSFNWFILGTLTYPTLPRAAKVVAPPFLRFINQVMRWVGVYSL